MVIGLEDLLLQRRVDALLAPWSRNDGAGVTIGVVLEGVLRVHRHAGLASIEHAVPIGDDTRFRIASVSKQFTCAAILMLESEGALSVDEPAKTYLPEIPASAHRVTVAQMMHNSSGLRDMFEIIRHGGGDLGTPVASQDLLDAIARQRALNFEPGSRFLYSNSNFLLLGLIVERLSGRSLDAFLQERIFGPLGMRDTRVTPDTAEMIPRLATGYLRGDDALWRRAPHAFPLGGEGGLVSSVPDLALWAQNFSTKRVGAAWLDGLMTQTPFSNGTENRYARGLVVRPYRGMATWSHGGLWPGFRTEFLMVPEQQAAVIAIANHGGADPNLLAHRALDAVLETRPGVYALPARLPSATLRRLVGRYVDGAGDTTLDIDVNDAREPTLTTNGVPVVAEATEDGRLAAPRSSSVFALRP
ncbi:MAG: beta-lactamase family protein, partial [Pseudomonadota bacterium]|nr:beta-lactamase family protein [Pseudomonadota bacterium]